MSKSVHQNASSRTRALAGQCWTSVEQVIEHIIAKQEGRLGQALQWFLALDSASLANDAASGFLSEVAEAITRHPEELLGGLQLTSHRRNLGAVTWSRGGSFRGGLSRD